MKNKVMDLTQAIDRYVSDGCSLSLGGFTVNRNPMAAIHEIIRQKKKNLHVLMHSGGQHFDLLVGAGLVEIAEIAYGANGRFASTCVRFRKAVENGEIKIEDYSNFHMVLRFLGGAMGVPFLPTRSGLAADIVTKWGFSKSFRRGEPRVANKKLMEFDDPFADPGEKKQILLLPSINPDVTIVHVQKADIEGNVRIEGLTFADKEQMQASRHVIVTCEDLFTTDKLRQKPDANLLPAFSIDAVVHVPFGAHPTACLNYYDYDSKHLKNYFNLAQYDEQFETYLREYVLEVGNFTGYLKKIGGCEALLPVLADPDLGYAKGLKR